MNIPIWKKICIKKNKDTVTVTCIIEVCIFLHDLNSASSMVYDFPYPVGTSYSADIYGTFQSGIFGHHIQI